jgi:hypothetical protein
MCRIDGGTPSEWESYLPAADAVLAELGLTQAEPVALPYLCNGMRFKVMRYKGAGELRGLPASLIGEWVAFVDATDGKHLAAPQPQAAASSCPTPKVCAEDVALVDAEFRLTVADDSPAVTAWQRIRASPGAES